MQTDHGIHLAGLRVLKYVGLGVGIASVQVHAERRNRTLVKAQVCEGLAVGAPCQGDVKAKFLFVDPVGGSVEDGVVFSVGRDLLHRSRSQVLYVNVALKHKGELGSVGRQHGVLNRLAVDLREIFGLTIKYVNLGRVRVAVNGFDVGLENHVALAGGEFVAAKAQWGPIHA